MIEEITGIRRIRMVYLQLLYRCNFECLHCFHGERLKHADAFGARVGPLGVVGFSPGGR